MLELIRRYPLGFALAVLLHLLIVLLMVFGLDWLNPPEPRKPVQVVQARLVDASQLQQAARKKQQEEEKRRQAELERKRRLEEKRRREAEAKRKAALEQKKKQEAERKRKLEQERRKKLEAERRRREEARKKAEAERQRKLALQKKREAEKKRQLELERKRKLEEKKRREAEARRKEEARRKAEAERRRKEAAREAELAAQFQAEREARERASVIAAIKRQVESSWLRPPSASDRNLEAKVRVRVNESGAVLLVKVIKSSGNGAFDRSVVTAVYKAEPLPMPKSPRLRQEFRDFTFIFKPTSQ